MNRRLFSVLLLLPLALNSCDSAEQPPQADQRFTDILALSEVSIPLQKQAVLFHYLQDTLAAYPQLAQDSLFFSQEFQDFLHDESIAIFKYYDWKEITTSSIEWFSESKLETHFKDPEPFASPLAIDGFLPDSLMELTDERAFEIGTYLKSRGYALCNLDCDCDCLRLMLILEDDYSKAQTHAMNLGCHLSHWGR